MLEVNVKPTTQTGFNLKLGYNDVTIVTLIRMARWNAQCIGNGTGTNMIFTTTGIGTIQKLVLI